MTSASTWRDAEPDQFAAALLAAAEQLGVLPLAVEKDYWVCEALRAITSSHPGEVVFKGGTSLEKLRIIRRFSEDLDLLVVGDYASNRAAERALKSLVEAAASGTLGTPTGGRSGGEPGSFHRSAYLAPPMAHSAVRGAIADASAILIELGQSGGPNPHETERVESLLARQLHAVGFETAAWSDLAALEVAVLHPGRTLIEKLLRVNNFASDPETQAGIHGWSRIGRQFYDVWALLGRQRFSTFSRTGQQPARSSPVASRSHSPSSPTNRFRTAVSPPAPLSTLTARSQGAFAPSTKSLCATSTTGARSRRPSMMSWSESRRAVSCSTSRPPRDRSGRQRLAAHPHAGGQVVQDRRAS